MSGEGSRLGSRSGSRLGIKIRVKVEGSRSGSWLGIKGGVMVKVGEGVMGGGLGVESGGAVGFSGGGLRWKENIPDSIPFHSMIYPMPNRRLSNNCNCVYF